MGENFTIDRRYKPEIHNMMLLNLYNEAQEFDAPGVDREVLYQKSVSAYFEHLIENKDDFESISDLEEFCFYESCDTMEEEVAKMLL